MSICRFANRPSFPYNRYVPVRPAGPPPSTTGVLTDEFYLSFLPGLRRCAVRPVVGAARPLSPLGAGGGQRVLRVELWRPGAHGAGAHHRRRLALRPVDGPRRRQGRPGGGRAGRGAAPGGLQIPARAGGPLAGAGRLCGPAHAGGHQLLRVQEHHLSGGGVQGEPCRREEPPLLLCLHRLFRPAHQRAHPAGREPAAPAEKPARL